MRKILFGAKYSVIEPLGLLHLASVAKQEGFDPHVSLVRDREFRDFDAQVKRLSPEYVGFTVYTGNHLQTFEYLDSLRKRRPDIKVVIGGPHPTFFPADSSPHADYVVLSEGFGGLREVLSGRAQKGIVPIKAQEDFPPSEREGFYKAYPEHRANPIKSVITATGCPYSCTYCYNSCTLEAIAGSLTEGQRKTMAQALPSSGRLFPKSKRTVQAVLDEVEEIKRSSPETRMIYFQDDVFGADINWTREFAKAYPATGLPFHAQLRFEYADPVRIMVERELDD